MSSPLIFLAIPTRGGIHPGLHAATHRMGNTRVQSIRSRSCSLLTMNFNILWCEALNERGAGITHFVMCHDDIEPLDAGWIDTLFAEHEAIGADITHVVSPIKDERGITSTAFMDPDNRQMKRLTIQEAVKLPKTFTADMAGQKGCVILPNTGLWICDFTKPWVEQICFTIRDRIEKMPDGAFRSQCWSEDWHFGLQACKLGLTVAATTAVRISHHGTFAYPNFIAWGNVEHDGETNFFNPKEDDVNVTSDQLFASIGQKQMEIELLRAENLQLLAANKALSENALKANLPESITERAGTDAALTNGVKVEN